MKNSIDKMAEQFTSVEELQAYADAQYKTILDLNEKLNTCRVEIEKLRADNRKLSTQTVVQNTVPDDSKFRTTDEETACVIQIALIKNNALERELTMDEVKRLEILTKTLYMVRGKIEIEKPRKDASKMTTEELLKFMEDEEQSKKQQ